MPELSTIYDYMRAHASLLGARILQEYPALHHFDDPASPRIDGLLRRPFPAQTIAIMGVAKRWQQARTGMVVAVWDIFVVHRRSRKGEARLLLAPCLPCAPRGSIPGLRGQFRHGQACVCRRQPLD